MVYQSIAKLVCVSKILAKSDVVLAHALRVLLSARFWRIATVIRKINRFLRGWKVKKENPIIETCGTLEVWVCQ